MAGCIPKGNPMLKNLRSQLFEFLNSIKGRADFTIFVLSTLTLILFIVNEVLSISGTGTDVLIGPYSLPQLLLGTRLVVWVTFVAHFLAYAIVSANLRQYLKNHILEVLVCIGWFPHYNEGLLRHIPSFFSVEMIQLVGSLANASLVMRFFVKRFRTDPLIVTGSAFLLLVVTASGLLMHVEPQTFPNWFDAGWYCIVTLTTVGYGDIVPHTLPGRGIGVGLMICGIGLAAALIGIISQTLQRSLGQEEQKQEKPQSDLLNKQLADQRALLERIAGALEKDNQLKEKLLAVLERRDGEDKDNLPPTD